MSKRAKNRSQSPNEPRASARAERRIRGRRTSAKLQQTTLAQVCGTLEKIAPLALAQEWDNVGLIAGDAGAAVRRVLLCIDLTAAVVDEALARKVDLVLAYHPPLFRPITRLHGQGRGTDAHVFRCIAGGVAIYSMHTALDAADGGTNDVLAQRCGIAETSPLEYTAISPPACKVVVFVPAESADTVATAMFDAGAGHIGDYERCSYRLAGQGTFRGSESTKPAIGTAGQFERVDELRIETIVPKRSVPAVVEALRRAHPYEEPAFDVYPLESAPVRGIGRVGKLTQPTTLGALAKKLKRTLPAPCTQIIGDPATPVTRAVICVGSAGSLPFRVALTADDVIITGEIRHHDALTIQRHGCSAIALSHWASERPALEPLAKRIGDALPLLDVAVSEADCDPFADA